jgi:TPR repeat protein
MMLRAKTVMAAVVATFALSSSNASAGDMAQGRIALESGQYAQSRLFYKAASERGDMDAMFHLARMYELGLGGPKDFDGALALYRQAAGKGNAASSNRLGLYYFRGEDGKTPDYKKARELFESASNSGDANGSFNLGQIYRNGNGVASDEAKAIDLFESAAAKDHILALNTLGSFYKGQPTEQAKTKANDYFARSAAFGNALGLYELALSKLHQSQNRDALVSAHMYLNLASARGLEQATLSLQELSKAMLPSDIALAQAKAREFKAVVSEERD